MIPIIGSNPTTKVEVTLTDSPPELIIWAGLHGTRLPLALPLIRTLLSGLHKLEDILEAQQRPLTGDGSNHAGLDVFRNQAP